MFACQGMLGRARAPTEEHHAKTAGAEAWPSSRDRTSSTSRGQGPHLEPARWPIWRILQGPDTTPTGTADPWAGQVTSPRPPTQRAGEGPVQVRREGQSGHRTNGTEGVGESYKARSWPTRANIAKVANVRFVPLTLTGHVPTRATSVHGT